MTINIIVAITPLGGIGLNGDLPWAHYHREERQPDMDYFRKTTMGGICIMGRKTYDSIRRGRPLNKATLPGRSCWVVSNTDITGTVMDNRTLADGDSYFNTYEGAFAEYQHMLRNGETRPLWVIGGASAYEFFTPLADVLHLTMCGDLNLEHDVSFPFNPTEMECMGFDPAGQPEGAFLGESRFFLRVVNRV